jgi:hypothetical protein
MSGSTALASSGQRRCKQKNNSRLRLTPYTTVSGAPATEQQQQQQQEPQPLQTVKCNAAALCQL